MPILDPSLQISLIKKYKELPKNDGMGFFLTYLRIAAHNINRNFKTIESSLNFKTNISNGVLQVINHLFNCNIKLNDIKNPLVTNIYKYFYDKTYPASKENQIQSKQGRYLICTDKYQTNLYQIKVIMNGRYSWFLSDTPIAILCIKKMDFGFRYYQLIKFEASLLASAGYTLVCCVGDAEYLMYILELIKSNLFSEIHFNLNYSDMDLDLSDMEESFQEYQGHVYLYSKFIDYNIKDKEKEKQILDFEKVKNFPRVHFISLSSPKFNNLNEFKILETKPFAYCKNGFDYEYLPIRLSNVPLYDSEDEIASSIPSQTSGISLGYISADDFLNWKKFRIKIIFIDSTNQKNHTEKFIDFDDVHKVRPDLYVSDQLVLAKINSKMLDSVDKMEKTIHDKIYDRKDSKFITENIISFIKDKKIKKSLQYVAYAYSYAQYKKGYDFFAHRTQIYTAYEACRRFIIKKKDGNTKGTVFQVETGEGKTCIVCMIAAALALMDKTVHITSSNIKLSIRDFEDSYRFFRLLKISSALLVHSNELPLAVRKKFKHDNLEINETTEKQNDKEGENNKNKDKKVIIKDDSNNNDSDNKYIDKNDSDNKYIDKNDSDNKCIDKNVKKDTNVSTSAKNDSDMKNINKNDSNTCILDTASDEKSEQDVDSFFGSNSDSYFKLHTQETDFNTSRYYKDKYYNASLFRNSTRMNYSVCGLNEQGAESTNKAQVVFSTFVNFECFYLKMVELCPGSIQDKFSHYGLLVDEADSILIDEIANGTIVSRSMNSNAKDILKFVYDNYHKKPKQIPFNETYEMIKNEPKWANCHGIITVKHVEQMYKEIELVHTPEYQKGKRYSIEKIEVKKKKKMNRFFKKALNFTKELALSIGQDFIKEFTKDPNAEDDDDEDDDDDDNDDDSDDDDDDESDDDDDDDKKNDDGNPMITFHHIVPFSYDRNGILEPNKEFGGFVQQFIAIKESEKYQNMIVNDLSMSYLYISHPIFVKLYGTVCGFTGTVGNDYDKKIFKDQYSLNTMKVPRHNPNLSVEFPMIFCKNKAERNQKIADEVVEFHKRGNPVLVIFQNLIEIDDVHKILIQKDIKYINIFDGRDETLRPDLIAGINGAVSLGTNVCGRGTNIRANGLPLHIIVSYYSSNIRVMKQAFGRTARQGRKGTYRVICIESEYFKPVDVLKNTGTILNEYDIKNSKQKEFVDHFEKNRKWIFSGFPGEHKINGGTIQFLRDTKINVNRIIASNFVFPICMNIKTFLKIQEQRIFSLFNCPNSRFTWRLFQRYIRELILESWSLLINEIDQEFENKEKGEIYKSTLQEKMKDLLAILDKKYFPPMNNGIVDTFMFIFRRIRKKYEDKILDDFSSTKMACPLLKFNPSEFFCCTIGFKPYALLSESGARISSKNFKKTNYIKDPELQFQQKTIKNKFKLISITQKVDDIFNNILKLVNNIIGSKTFLKLFLRRTIAGCEFGFCLTLDIKNNNIQFMKDHPYCIIDRDPLFVFTIFVRSILPVLAIILISLLVYLASIAKKISNWFVFPKNAQLVLKKTASIVINCFTKQFAEEIYGKILDFLKDNLEVNINLIDNFDKNNASIIRRLKELFESSGASGVTKKISEYLDNKFDFMSKLGDIGSSLINPVYLMKISAYLLLLLASFIMLYRHKKKDITYYNEKSKQYDDNPTEENLHTMLKKVKKELKKDKEFNITDIQNISEEQNEEYQKDHIKESQKYLFKLTFFQLLDKFIESPSFKFDKKTLINKGISLLAQGIFQEKRTCFRVTYSGSMKIFEQQIRFYATNKFPSIINLVGYTIEKKKKHIFLDFKEKGTLKQCLNSGEKIDLTHKLIIAFGIACAMNHLHNNKIVHRYLKPSNIFLDSNYYPYLSNFYRAKQIEISFPYKLKNMSLKYEPPEFLINYDENQDSFYLDVYSFGMTLYNLIVEKQPFYSYSKSKEELIDEIKKDQVHPIFQDPFPPELEDWKKLISKCINKTPEDRPLFTDIISYLINTISKNKNIDRNLFNKYKEKVIKVEES